ncbi:RNA 2',3'-cyclic phosphodiesterase [Pseudoxanthomonas japonensis]|uniref:RNA 2',3'-cyclic phosphodiesterase n=2 Tax=Pseudoxanthomonas japonensis TaxID=69284 RepID=A0ABQ6ZDS8_9GAMM|nr:RNA 2',3'-cyclic phosphodiesterase [Pseudoxanthomonas japonensis]
MMQGIVVFPAFRLMPATPASSSQGDLFGSPQPGRLHRLFFALVPSAGEREGLRHRAEDLKAAFPQARWVRPERYHLTLHFLGESDGPREDMIRTARDAMQDWQPEPVGITLDHLLCLGNPKNPALTLAALHPSPAVVAFWRGLQQRLLRAGFKQHVGRSFVPHLTLAYVPPRTTPVDVPPVVLHPQGVHLLQSIEGEADYDVLGEWPLG